ncbi:MAG: hypothetical protein J6A52_07655 [Bacilli bacterium]|nr:hypothetical protein [Bacilli bacterium]
MENKEIINNTEETNIENDKLKKKVKRLSISVIILIIAFVLLATSVILLALDSKKNNIDNKEQENNNSVEEDNNDNNSENSNLNDDNNDEPTLDSNIELIDVSLQEVSKLLSLIKLKTYDDTDLTTETFLAFFEPESLIYSKEKITPKDFYEWTSLNIYIERFLKFHNIKCEEVPNDNCGQLKITKEELQKILNKLFGDGYSAESKNFSNMNYIEEEDKYVIGGCYGDTGVTSSHAKLIKAERKEDYIYIYEKVGLTDLEDYYSNGIDGKKTPKELNGKSIWEYEDDLSTFMYTFKKGVDGEYHLESMEYYEIK